MNPTPRRSAATLVLIGLLLAPGAFAQQQYQFDIAVEAGTAERVDLTVDAAIDLSTFMGSIAGTLDPATFQVLEVDTAGVAVNDSVAFQFDAAAGFDPATNVAGNMIFVMNDTTPALGTRHFRVLFDVEGACLDCPAPPVVPVPTTLDSLFYENQLAYLISTPRADYYYHLAGGGLASIIDGAGNDWISYHDIPGSGETGQYRGIPNMVLTPLDGNNSFFHPGATNSTTTLVSHGPLKVTLRSISNNPANVWIVRWDFYQTFARMTVEQVGSSNGGDYWLLYEGTPGGSLDLGDVIVRSDGTTTNAANNLENWELAIPDPQWVYFHDTSASRYLFIGDETGDTAPDSHRAMGQTSGPNAGMTVFGLGRVLHTSLNPFVPHLSGEGRSYTIGIGENNLTAPADINGLYAPVTVTVGEPVLDVSAVGDNLPGALMLHQNYPNPFNPATTISFVLPTRSRVELAVYDMAGRLVRSLLNDSLAAGPHAIRWEGDGQDGRMIASGIYFYRLVAPDGIRQGKMTLVE